MKGGTDTEEIWRIIRSYFESLNSTKLKNVPAQQGNLTWYQKIQYRAVEGKDGQTPRQELLQPSKKQHEITRSQRPYNRRT